MPEITNPRALLANLRDAVDRMMEDGEIHVVSNGVRVNLRGLLGTCDELLPFVPRKTGMERAPNEAAAKEIVAARLYELAAVLQVDGRPVEAHDLLHLCTMLNYSPPESVRVSLDDQPVIEVVFDGPPGHVAGRFIEAEIDGKSVAGEWKPRGDYWVLRLPQSRSEFDRNEIKALKLEVSRLRSMFDTTRHRVLRAMGESDRGKSWNWIEGALSGAHQQLVDQIEGLKTKLREWGQPWNREKRDSP